MINKLEFWIGLVVAALLAAALMGGSEHVVTWASQSGLGQRLLGARLDEPLLLASLAIALGTLVWMIIGWVIPALALSRQVAAALEEDVDSGQATLVQLNERMDGGLLPAMTVTATGLAAGALPDNGRNLLERHAGGWFFRRLPLAALALGTLAALVALASGHAGELQYARNAVDVEAGRPGLEGSVLALACFSTVAMGALVAALLYWLTGGPVAARLDRLGTMLRPQLVKSSALGVEARLTESLTSAIGALTSAAERLANIEERAVHDGLAYAADQFLERIEATTATRAAAMAETMAAMERSAVQLLDAMEQFRGKLSEETAAQIHGLAESYAETLATLQNQQAEQVAKVLNQFSAVAAEMRSITETAVSSVTEQVRETRDATQEALTLLRQDAGTTQSIRDAAEQMSAAARASRETVERFIALAERMRDLNQSISTQNSAGELAATAASIGRIEPPLTSPETARRLSKAIRSLKQSASESLPEL